MVFVPQFYSYSDFWALAINLTFLQLLTPETCNAVLNHLTTGTGVESSDDQIRFGRDSLKGEGGSSLLSMFFTRKHNDITGYISTAYSRIKLEYVSKVDNFQIWQHFQ